MKIDKEYLSQLVLFEISGKIQEDEKAYLHQMISESKEAYDIYRELYKMYPESKLQELRQSLGAEKVWIAIRKTDRRKKIRNLVSTAALFLLMSSMLLYFFLQHEKKGAPIASLNTSEHVTLQLNNGKTIDLSNNQGQVTVGNMLLNNKNSTLSYSGDTINYQVASLSVPPGKNYTIQLQDGTEIQLNAATRLDFPFTFTGATREVSIDGEAYLKVAKNVNKPFLVHLRRSTVTVLGTAFNVNTYDSSTIKVALVEGAVKMKAGNDTMLLKPGYEISLTSAKGMLTEKFDADNVLAWRQGIHLFEAASEEEVARLIQRFYGIEVVLDSKVRTKKPFTGSMNRNRPLQNFLEGLKFTQYLSDYYFDKDSVLHIK